MMKKTAKKRQYISPDPHKKGKRLYLVYKYNEKDEELSSEGPYLSEKEAYNIMHKFLGIGICSWVVIYNA